MTTPSSMRTPSCLQGPSGPRGWRLAANAWRFTPYTTLFNVTGQPGMSVPLVWSKQGLPLGVQVVGRFGDESTLFRLAGQLERARPWADRRPRVWAGQASASVQP